MRDSIQTQHDVAVLAMSPVIGGSVNKQKECDGECANRSEEPFNESRMRHDWTALFSKGDRVSAYSLGD